MQAAFDPLSGESVRFLNQIGIAAETRPRPATGDENASINPAERARWPVLNIVGHSARSDPPCRAREMSASVCPIRLLSRETYIRTRSCRGPVERATVHDHTHRHERGYTDPAGKSAPEACSSSGLRTRRALHG